MCAGGGALFALASPPLDLYPSLWIGMAILAASLERAAATGKSRWHRALAGGGRGLAFGVGANVVALRFVPAVIARFTPLPWVAGAVALVLLACEQAGRWATAGIVHTQLARRGVPSWLAFGTGVYTGTFVPAVFPWTAAGGVTPAPAMVQFAELVGERGVTLLMALSAGLVASAFLAFRRKQPRRLALLFSAGLGIPLLTYLEGRTRISHVEEARREARTVAVGLVQPSTAALERWDPSRASTILSRLTNLTITAERRGAELTIWPEAAYPYPVAHRSRRCPVGGWAVLPMGVRGPVLTGLVMTGGDGDLWNSAAICRTSGEMSPPYDKLRLLWFGETIPVLDRIPWIRRTFSRGTGLVPGTGNVVQSEGPVRASVLNCFEDTLPEAGREAMADGPNLLVNVTNDAWFAGSEESELHLRIATLRAVESRRDFVRAVNLGPTTWVDAAGVVRGRYDGTLAGVLIANPALLEWEPTLFDRFGDAPTLLGLAAWITVILRRRRDDKREKGAAR